jgi:hypothetical protein
VPALQVHRKSEAKKKFSASRLVTGLFFFAARVVPESFIFFAQRCARAHLNRFWLQTGTAKKKIISALRLVRLLSAKCEMKPSSAQGGLENKKSSENT